jgi:hypothetical protein
MTKQREATRPMIEALQAMTADSRLKSQAYHFLKSDLMKLKSVADFTQAYAGLLAAQQLLGPMNDGYRQALKEMRVILDVSIQRRLLPARDYDQKLDDLHKAIMEDAFGLIKSYLPEKVWNDLVKLFETAFNKPRLREGLS